MGSEMCIRDRAERGQPAQHGGDAQVGRRGPLTGPGTFQRGVNRFSQISAVSPRLFRGGVPSAGYSPGSNPQPPSPPAVRLTSPSRPTKAVVLTGSLGTEADVTRREDRSMRAGETTTTRTRRGRAVPWAMLGLWIAVIALVGPFAAKLGSVQHDKVTDYLPASADSTQAAKIEEKLPGGETTEMVLVYHRDGGLSAADRKTAAGQVAEITRQHKLIGGAPEGIPSKDGTTLMYPIASNEPGADEEKQDNLVTDRQSGVFGLRSSRLTQPAQALGSPTGCRDRYNGLADVRAHGQKTGIRTLD